MKQRIVTLPVSSIKPNDWNFNVMTPRLYEKAKASIKKFGFVAPVVVRPLGDGTYELVDGEHRWKAAVELGLTHIPAVVLEEYEDAEAKALSIALNEIKGKADAPRLAAVLYDLTLMPNAEELLEPLPFLDKELAALSLFREDTYQKLAEEFERAKEEFLSGEGFVRVPDVYRATLCFRGVEEFEAFRSWTLYLKEKTGVDFWTPHGWLGIVFLWLLRAWELIPDDLKKQIEEQLLRDERLWEGLPVGETAEGEASSSQVSPPDSGSDKRVDRAQRRRRHRAR